MKERFFHIFNTRRRRNGLIIAIVLLLCIVLIGGLSHVKQKEEKSQSKLTRAELISLFDEHKENAEWTVMDCVAVTDLAYDRVGVLLFTDETGESCNVAFMDKNGFYQYVSIDAKIALGSRLTYLGDGQVTVKLAGKDGSVYLDKISFTLDGVNVSFKQERIEEEDERESASATTEQRLLYYGGVGNLGTGYLMYSVPTDEKEDYRICFYQSDEYQSFEKAEFPYTIEEADYVFQDIRTGNAPLGNFLEIYFADFASLKDSEDDSVKLFLVAKYEKDGMEYYDTRIYDEATEGFRVNEKLMKELNNKYSNVANYPVEEVVNLPNDSGRSESLLQTQKPFGISKQKIFLKEMCKILPDFDSQTMKDDTYWRDFLFYAYTGRWDLDRPVFIIRTAIIILVLLIFRLIITGFPAVRNPAAI